MQAEHIDDVLYHLDQIVDAAHQKGDRIAYFACLYRHVTYAVKEGAAKGVFENGQRIEDLDVTFANRYFEAMDFWQRGNVAVQSWKVAFDASQRPGRLVMQHLFLGMNAHINLDLAIATARTFPGDEIARVERDFNTMNDVLGGLVHHIEKELSHLWPILRLVHRFMHGEDDQILRFSMNGARAMAWDTAQRLAHMTFEQQEAEIRRLDAQVVGYADPLLNPTFPLSIVIAIFAWLQREREVVPRVINMLSDDKLRQNLAQDQAAIARMRAAQSGEPSLPSPVSR
jgi:hypothetical protein